MFTNAQEFYEHLDDCVLRVVQQEEPSEAINEQHLAEVANDQGVLDTLDRHMLPTGVDYSDQNVNSFGDEGVEDSKFKDENRIEDWTGAAPNKPRSGKGSMETSRRNQC